MVIDHYLLIQRWCPSFDPKFALITNTLIWVRLPNLPADYSVQAFLQKVGDKIGRFVRVYDNTLNATKGQFARLCVEVDLAKPHLLKFRFHWRIHHIEYEGLH